MCFCTGGVCFCVCAPLCLCVRVSICLCRCDYVYVFTSLRVSVLYHSGDSSTLSPACPMPCRALNPACPVPCRVVRCVPSRLECVCLCALLCACLHVSVCCLCVYLCVYVLCACMLLCLPACHCVLASCLRAEHLSMNPACPPGAPRSFCAACVAWTVLSPGWTWRTQGAYSASCYCSTGRLDWPGGPLLAAARWARA